VAQKKEYISNLVVVITRKFYNGGYFSVCMKHKTSVSFDEKTLYGIRDLMRSGLFRNKSHIVEYAVNKLLNEVNNDKVQ